MLRPLDSKTLVSGQIAPGDMAELKAAGVGLVINNRPDHEEPGQPTGAQIESAARAAGIGYRHIPIARGIGPAEASAMREALGAADGKLLCYCRSGMRSALAWATARRQQGASRDELERALEGAGFSASAIAHLP